MPPSCRSLALELSSLTCSEMRTITSNAAILVDGMGYNAASPGLGAGSAATNNGEGSGGGYGGAGGASAAGAGGGGTYGSATQPTNWGSAGGIYTSADPNLSQGGGAIELNVGGILNLNGRLSANGMPGIFPGSGGGAGGSVWVTAGNDYSELAQFPLMAAQARITSAAVEAAEEFRFPP